MASWRRFDWCKAPSSHQRKRPRFVVVLCIAGVVVFLLYGRGMVLFLLDTLINVLSPRCTIVDDTRDVANLSCPLGLRGTERNESIIMTFATAGWFPLVGNWISSIQKAGINGTVIVVSLDGNLCPMIHANATLRQGVTCFEALKENMYHNREKELASSNGWGSSNYRRIITFRTQVIYSMVLCGRTLLLADVDVVFLRDPMEDLRATRQRSSQKAGEEYDMLFQRDSMGLKVLDYFDTLTVRGRWYVCAGFVFMAPTKNTRHFWTRIMKYQELDWNDQSGINKCLILSKPSVNWKVLSARLYSNGFYLQKDHTDWKLKNAIDGYFTKRNQSLVSLVPYMIHFNWIHGVAFKRKAMKNHSVWFF